MLPHLIAWFFGRFELQYARNRDGPCQSLLLPPTLKSQSLLAYLIAFRHQAHTRERLAESFWGDRPERRARRSLSTALWQIHHCLPHPDFVRSTATTLQFDPTLPLWLDVQAFEAQAAQPDLANLQAAIDLYRGDFLSGFCDEWVISERYRLESLWLDVLARLMAARETLGDQAGALAAARQILDKDPLREDAHRMVMRTQCQLGQRYAALAQYRACQQLLRQELDTAPMAETQALYRAIVEGRFACAPSAPEGMAAVAVVSHPPVQGRSPLDATARFPLVGREQELAGLAETWQAALAGQCSLLLISGEAGVGKTRLAQEFADQQRWQNVRVLLGPCYEFERLLPYQPVVEALHALPRAVADAACAAVPGWVSNQVARLAPGLVGHTPDAPGSTSGQDGADQERLFEGVAHFLAQLAVQQPLLLILEDLHWASDSTLHLLHYLARHLVVSPLLLVGTLRPEMVSPAQALAAFGRRLERDGLARRLSLFPLSAAAVASLIEQVSGAGEAAQPLAERLYRETEGNPFYLIQTLKALFEAGTIRAAEGVWQIDETVIDRGQLPLPAGVSEMIAERVGRLGAETQGAAQVAAVVGRTFDFDLLLAAWGHGEDATLAAIDDLLRQRLIGEGGSAGPDYAFTHHKIQEVIYTDLPRRRRQHLHGQVGTALEELLGAKNGSRAAELAFHFEQAQQLDRRLADKAIAYLLQAGQQAMRQSANQEAIAYVQRGLEIVHALPETAQRVQQEIDLQIALTLPTTVVYGYGSAEAGRVYARARELCHLHEDPHALFATIVGLARYYAMAGDLATGVALTEQLVATAQAAGDTGWLVEACRLNGGLVFAQGRLHAARAVLERGLALYDPAYHERHSYRFGHDPAVAILNYLNLALWLLGYPAQAHVQFGKLEQVAQAVVHPTSQAIARCMLANSACMRRDGEAALRYAEAGVRLGQAHRLPSWKALASAFQGWALADRGESAEGLAQLIEGTAAWRAMGTRHFAPFLLGLQAEACLKAQKVAEGLAASADGLEIAQSGGDTYWLPELCRVRGELLWAGGQDVDSVEACFRDAQATAHQQAARMLELRATMSLARLWQSQGQTPAARQMLAAVYAQFDEGFDNHDLLAAEAMLRSL
jgi:DNA-binding SARP family transcriptional activator/predicted ATPase